MNKLIIERKYRPSLIILGVAAVVCIIVAIGDFKEEEEITKNKIETIAFVTDVPVSRNTESMEYTFFYNGKKIEAIETKQNKYRRKHIGRYFIVIFSSKNPSHSTILLNAEILDSKRIKEAGFKIK